MTAPEYRKLITRIMKRYRQPLKLRRFDAAELADNVYWGEMSEALLFDLLDRTVADPS